MVSKVANRACALAAALLAAVLVLSCASSGEIETTSPRALTVHRSEHAPRERVNPHLRVATLNIAHGRGDSLNQLLVSRDKTRDNLDAISQFLQAREIHIAALQEADAPSWWSGDFDHAAYLAGSAGFSHWAQASHASLGVGHYGTAVLSQLPIGSAMAQDFAPSPPTANKGFTLAEITWPLDTGASVTIDVVSIHMDFSRKSVRESQMRELDQVMQNRRNPLVLMGDFNSETLADRLVAQAAQNSRHLHTVPFDQGEHSSYKDKRLDWIIVSGDFEIVDYVTAPEVLSDHRAVIATLALKP